MWICVDTRGPLCDSGDMVCRRQLECQDAALTLVASAQRHLVGRQGMLLGSSATNKDHKITHQPQHLRGLSWLFMVYVTHTLLTALQPIATGADRRSEGAGMLLTGYLDRLSARPGDDIATMISAERGPVTIDLVRLMHGDTNPMGPGFKEETVTDVPVCEVPAHVQDIWTGSCLRAEQVIPPGTPQVHLDIIIWPTRPTAGRVQGIFSVVDEVGAEVVSLALDETGCVHLRADDGRVLARADRSLRERRWYRLSAEVSAEEVALSIVALEPTIEDAEPQILREATGVDLVRAAGVTVAAQSCTRDSQRFQVFGAFNGKVERPVIHAGETLLGSWALEREPADELAVDISGNDRHGQLVNMPTRAMTGHNWNGDIEVFQHAPAEYGAIHFHDDDFVDAGWDVDAVLHLPEGLRTGIYAVRLRVEGQVDRIPLAVLPPPAAPRSRLAYLLPTFTYVAYANERLMHRLDYEAAGITDHPIDAGRHDRLLAEHPEFGGSLYDLHTDGSGVCYSSYLRPIPNLRPDYRMWLQNAPRHLGADLYLIDFFESSGIDYDVITDHDLHAEGVGLIDAYQVVVTGSHPEYYSGRMLDALQAHAETGGCLMYLGGNGFYWVTSQDLKRPHVLEVRRSGGVRTWEIRPGEQYHSTSGERGGLWRWRGRSPNKLVGVGMCSQGWDEKAPAFTRTPLSYEPQWAWVFEGVEDDLIGDFGLIMNGASGDEVDRCDVALGSPPNTAVLATSQRHSDYYQLAVEDVLMLAPGLGGSECENVRSDMVIVEQPSGGAVFSVGSICFTGCLPWNGYDNNVARLVENVLHNFEQRQSKRS